MGTLIDDLLRLARITQGGLSLSMVNLSHIAAEIREELQHGASGRHAEFMIAPDIVASGDARLLRVVLENLFSNAWKFTATQPVARIEFGSEPMGGQTVLFVRDNGVRMIWLMLGDCLALSSAFMAPRISGHGHRPRNGAAHRQQARRTHLGGRGPWQRRNLPLHPFRSGRPAFAGVLLIANVRLLQPDGTAAPVTRKFPRFANIWTSRFSGLSQPWSLVTYFSHAVFLSGNPDSHSF